MTEPEKSTDFLEEHLAQTSNTNKLCIQPTLSEFEIVPIAEKYIEKTLFGKKQEKIQSIELTYLQLMRLQTKTMSRKIFSKEKEGMIYWDTITSEIITGYSKKLKRSKGVRALFDLLSSQINILCILKPGKGLSVDNIAKDTNLELEIISQDLKTLEMKSLALMERDKETREPLYSRLINLTFPLKIDKIKIELPTISKIEIKENILKPRITRNEIEKIIKTLSPKTIIIDEESIYYPYYKIELLGKIGPHVIFLDAVSGKKDDLLSKIMKWNENIQ